MEDCKFSEMKSLVPNNKWNKVLTFAGVILALSFSCVLIGFIVDRDFPYSYSVALDVLLCCCVLVFIVFSLFSAFTCLIKVLKSEAEMNAKILDAQLYLYKEEKMREITRPEKK